MVQRLTYHRINESHFSFMYLIASISWKAAKPFVLSSQPPVSLTFYFNCNPKIDTEFKATSLCHAILISTHPWFWALESGTPEAMTPEIQSCK